MASTKCSLFGCFGIFIKMLVIRLLHIHIFSGLTPVAL